MNILKDMSMRMKLLTALGCVYVMFIGVYAVNLYEGAQLLKAIDGGRAAIEAAGARPSSGDFAAVAARYRDLGKQVAETYRTDWIVFGGTAVIALVVILMLLRHYMQVITNNLEGMRRLAEGDLTMTVAGKYKGDDAVNRASGMLGIVSERFNKSLGGVSASAEAITVG